MIGIFMLFVIVAVCVILIIQYNFNRDFTQKIAYYQFNILSRNISKDLNRLNETYENFVEIYTSFLKYGSIQDILKEKKQLMRIYTDFLQRNKNIYALYVGSDEDIFFNLRRVDKNRVATEEYTANKDDIWLTREVANGFETRAYYDKHLNKTFSKKIQATYIATQRPWYIKAINSKGKTVRTNPYKFSLFNEFGVTYSKEYKNGDVFSMDILLEDMNEMLEKRLILTSQTSCIVDEDFNIIAKTKLFDTQIGKKFFQDNPLEGIKEINDTKYIYKVGRFGQDFLISYANFDTLMSPYKRELEKNFIFAVVIVIILSFLVWALASIIIKPIAALAKENRKIELREFDNIQEIDSCVFEISQLSSSIVKMAHSIKQHHEELKYLSITDMLTKIYNRAKLESTLQIKVDDFNRYGYKFGIILIDIDDFKEVNDNFGHQVGDKFLIEFANLLKRNIRKSDIVGRWGGEEFTVICKETGIENLEKLAYKLKNSIESYIFENIINKTASFGVAQYKKDESIDELINRADKALYEAKNRGRNRVIVG